jgi:TPR repeat protein
MTIKLRQLAALSSLMLLVGASVSMPTLADTKTGMAAVQRKDYATAWRELIGPAQQGDPDAEALIGAMLQNHVNPGGTGIYRDCESWLLRAANHGNLHGMTFLAKFYSDNAKLDGEGEYKKARYWYEKAANLGSGYAMGSLAIMLDAGVGGPSDPARAAQLREQMKHVTDPNLIDATVVKKVTADPAGQAMTAQWQAAHYADALKTAYVEAAKGNATAEALIGRSYYEGHGAPQNYQMALPWFNKAAAQKNADALYYLGMMYEYGRGVYPNIPKAVSLLDQSAALGNRYADIEVGGMRMEGEAAQQVARYVAACRNAGGFYNGETCTRGGMMFNPY